ncbi:MAG TPA: hypothetical protein VGD11_15855 [Mycobacteriales bacterium]|jgi:hypothetical protein
MEHGAVPGNRRTRGALAQVRAVEALAASWERHAERMEEPEGFLHHEDAGTAAAAIRRALATA